MKRGPKVKYRAVARVVAVLERSVPHWSPERILAIAVVRQALFDICDRDRPRMGQDALESLDDGGIDYWLGSLGIEGSYFRQLCQSAGIPLEQREAAA